MVPWTRSWTPTPRSVNGCGTKRDGEGRTRTVPPRRRLMVNSILVLTTVHNPEDARIRFRQITTLLESGWRVTYAAPFSAYGLSPKEQTRPGLNVIDMPRALGRRRARSLFAAHRLLKQR